MKVQQQLSQLTQQQLFQMNQSRDNSLESRLSSNGGAIGSDKVQLTKVGNSKILVVKKKAPGSVGAQPNQAQTLLASPPNLPSQFQGQQFMLQNQVIMMGNPSQVGNPQTRNQMLGHQSQTQQLGGAQITNQNVLFHQKQPSGGMQNQIRVSSANPLESYQNAQLIMAQSNPQMMNTGGQAGGIMIHQPISFQQQTVGGNNRILSPPILHMTSDHQGQPQQMYQQQQMYAVQHQIRTQSAPGGHQQLQGAQVIMRPNQSMNQQQLALAMNNTYYNNGSSPAQQQNTPPGYQVFQTAGGNQVTTPFNAMHQQQQMSPNHQFINIQAAQHQMVNVKQVHTKQPSYPSQPQQNIILAVGQRFPQHFQMVQESPDVVMMGSGTGSQQESPMMVIQQNQHEGGHRMSQIDDNRALNSRRQFQIRNTSSNSKRRGGNRRNGALKSPSDFTNVGGKSVISLFTTNSGKTNQSAPVGAHEENSSTDGADNHGPNGSSPLQTRFKDSQIGEPLKTGIQLKKKTVSKNKIRPASSLSPGQHSLLTKTQNGGDAQLMSSSSLINFKTSKDTTTNGIGRSQSQDAPSAQDGQQRDASQNSSQGSKKLFPMRSIKFPIKKSVAPGTKPNINPGFSQTVGAAPFLVAQQQQSQLPKPPLAMKKNETINFNTTQPLTTTEALLRMADEGLANIEQELKFTNQKKPANKQPAPNAQSTLEKIRQMSKKSLAPEGGAPQQKQEIQANFNLSFNNSFNNSYTNGQLHQAAGGDVKTMTFTASQTKIKPKQDLSLNLHKSSVVDQPSDTSEGGANQDSPMHQTQQMYQGYFTADAIYLEKQLTNRLKEANDNEGKKLQAFTQTFNEIIKRDKNFGSLLLKIKQSYDEYIRKSALGNSPQSPTSGDALRSGEDALIRCDELKTQVRALELDLNAQKNKNEEMNRQMAAMRIEAEERKRAMEVMKSDNEKLANELKAAAASQNNNQINSNAIMKELTTVVQSNTELTSQCQILADEISYLKLREKKVMYLIYVLQNRGYPVNQVFEQEVKHIPTLRFQEFLDKNPDITDNMPSPGTINDSKNYYSFRTDDSFDLLCTGPNITKKRPANVPPLNLYGLPEYESSSDEEDVAGAQGYAGQQQVGQNPQQYYQESLKYIENFYNKFATQQQQQQVASLAMGGSSSQGYISDNNLSKSGGVYLGGGSGMPSNHHARDSSLINGAIGGGIDFGASSTQQISYYDYLSRDEEGDLSRNEEEQ